MSNVGRSPSELKTEEGRHFELKLKRKLIPPETDRHHRETQSILRGSRNAEGARVQLLSLSLGARVFFGFNLTQK